MGHPVATGHGTIDEYLKGCDCPDCLYAHKFVRLAEQLEEIPTNMVQKFATPRVDKNRPFPARDLVLAVGRANCKEVAKAVGVSRHSVSKWLREGVCFTVWDADKYACRVGLHPIMVWGEKWLVEDES